MTWHQRLGGASRRSFLAALAFLLLAGLLSTGPAAAHTFTRADGNDTPGKLDLQSVSVSHTSTGVVHKFKTFAPWTPQSLGDDSFFLVGINKDADPAYERCAFIFYHNGLKGSLSNCGNTFIRSLPVSRASGSLVKVTIPESETGDLYRWYGASIWDGPAPCGNGCVDFAPNRLPDILHDLIKPHVVMDAFPELSTEISADTVIPIGFTATDEGSGIKTWKIQSSPPGSLPYTTRAEGTGGGATIGNAVFPEVGATYDVRVRVTDKQGNVDDSATRRLIVPEDDAAAGMVYTGSWVADASDVEYFLATHHTGTTEGDTVTFTVTGENISIISGPGNGSVDVKIVSSASGETHLTMLLGPTGVTKRAVIYSLDFGAPDNWEITLTVQADSSFVFDGVASLET